jgi:hypothetical protein
MTQDNLYQAAAVQGRSSHIIVNNKGRVVAKVVTQYNKTNTACTAYLWIEGAGISKGRVTGSGYDRQSAAIAKAARTAPPVDLTRALIIGYAERRDNVVAALDQDNGRSWYDNLYNEGLTPINAL